MRIRMLVQMPPGGSRNGRPWPGKGRCEDIPTGEARHLVASGIAEEAPRRSRAKREQEEGT
ncbi:hypothetical protein [Streptomyces sp. NPDC048386]|uniref:hypothetical protein n=1 Tax=Streptomyces sp. NPDC048386 TaxID=3365541 RepID=UPI0037215626